jgi:hypothetical protein
MDHLYWTEAWQVFCLPWTCNNLRPVTCQGVLCQLFTGNLPISGKGKFSAESYQMCTSTRHPVCITLLKKIYGYINLEVPWKDSRVMQVRGWILKSDCLQCFRHSLFTLVNSLSQFLIYTVPISWTCKIQRVDTCKMLRTMKYIRKYLKYLLNK